MPHTHSHQWHGYTLRPLTLTLPDGLTRILTERRCRHCSSVERLTGSGTQGTPGKALPSLETFWTTPRTTEDAAYADVP